MLKLRTIRYNALIWALYLTSGWTNHSVAESLVVAYNHDWAPYSYLSESGNLQGILPHLTDRLIEEANAGLKVTKVGLPWNRVQQTVLRNQADAFITFASEERLQFADTIGPVFYALEQHPVTRLEDARAADDIIQSGMGRYCRMQGDNWSEEFYRALSITAFAAKDSRACLNLLDLNRADIFVHPRPIVRIRLEQMGLQNRLIQSSRPVGDMPFHLLVNRSSNERLSPTLTQVAETLARLRSQGIWLEWIKNTEETEIKRCLEENRRRC